MQVTPGTAMLLHFPHDNRYWLPPGGRSVFFYVCGSSLAYAMTMSRFGVSPGAFARSGMY
jgi:hypothetical protein